MRTVAATYQEFLRPTAFLDNGDGSVRDFARTAVTGISGDKAHAVALYKAVRPVCRLYRPDDLRRERGDRRRAWLLRRKIALLAACARAIGVPARPGFADVRNHLTSKRLRALTRSDIFVWHSYTELLIDGRWVKCTPAFDRALCERANLAPLDFDRVNDSLFLTHSTRRGPLPTSPTKRSWPISAGTIPG